ncbi:molybdenum ABC transporter ATP-binding protein [Solimicrobium silvestre]|uniref:Molybdate ABC transporter, ATP-binding protein n=1 Tax=Solimicrobium silvestre TaxID=2099400 RepID=A0A2S9GWX0_9BURK|nr:molybdenum ABC transporter ATP-binding protein [Solimicrobium silvestre]PRC92198.1 Molybdate ABC transporter, ATP-binding protein [Solimicrobium silvestre]
MSGVHLQLKLPNLAIDLSLPNIGISAIVGPSGAGKTTLLRAVAGLESVCRGRVDINGAVWQDDTQKIFLAAHQRSVGFVFQEASLFTHLSVQGNLEFGLRRIPVAEQKVSLSQAVELLGIGPLLNRSPATLSGGEKQRVAIARALATSPKLLLMDEPLASLDEPRKAEIFPYLERLHSELEIPLLYVSHATDEVARLADYVVMLDAGQVRASGSVFELLTRADLPFAHGDAASALIGAKVIAHDPHYQLSQFEFSGGILWLPHSATALGNTVRLRIQARDVSLSLTQQIGSSILNSLAVKISAIQGDALGLVMVELDAGGTRLLARITRKSAEQLGLVIGMALFAQIKGVAILK